MADDSASPDPDDGGDPPDPDPADGDVEVLLRLPDPLRSEFKDPLGPVYGDADDLLAAAGTPLIAVGDVVTYHLREAGVDPGVSVVDGYTERERASREVREVVLDADHRVPNPAATLSADLLSALASALRADDPTTVVVDGEEDLATLPAVLAAPDGAAVVYGQPGEGMVLVTVDADVRERFRDLFERLEGDHSRARELLGIPGSADG